ncbi:MAG: quinone-dependent dihydroorotate dehydrogenase [Bacteroidia bacterium]|nr:quinone-dependent dihydroorotate dehydrogenase [Bacteroidia bacterium]
MYSVIVRILFILNAEEAHHFTFSCIRFMHRIPGLGNLLRKMFHINDPALRVQVAGIEFPNPVGLAAGFDKDARLFSELASFGFGHIEIGTVTPMPQPGNDKPRLFRLVRDKAIINRMGFNNQGAGPAAIRLRYRKAGGPVIGGNIGKNKVTPNEEAEQDYLKCFHNLYPVVDYFTVNVSSPNTPGLRALQEKEPLTKLLSLLKQEALRAPSYKPVFLKIAPDLTNEQLDEIVEIVLETGIDGLIATNTTISREGLTSDTSLVNQQGGLSGKPLTTRATEVIRYIAEKNGKRFPIIAVGGIMTADDAMEKFRAGASLVQLYTGFIYGGPPLVKQIQKRYLAARRAGEF